MSGGVCVQCVLREFVEQLEQGIDPLHIEMTDVGCFEGDPRTHMEQVHPDVMAYQREGADLETRAKIAFRRLCELKRRYALKAQCN